MRLAFKMRGSRTVVDSVYQAGCLKVRLPRSDPGSPTEAVLLNTAGGMTGGDLLSSEIRWSPGTHAAVTTQACEKLYRTDGGTARVTTTLDIAQGATAEWLPQETIAFDCSALDRDLRIRLGVGATFTGIEAVVLGRSAMGEIVRRTALRDAWRIWRGNRLVYADALLLSGSVHPHMAQTAIMGGHTAFGTLIHVGPMAERLLTDVRDAIGGSDEAAASSWDGLLAVRFVASGGRQLRHAIVQVLNAIRHNCALPRVWQI